MTKFKKVLAAIIAAQFLLLLSPGAIVTNAATRRIVVKPRLQMAVQPKTQYEPGENISFSVTSPNYGGRVEYRVILWNGTTKKTSELWKTPKTGYYYKGWQPSGNYKFGIHWSTKGMEPGAYSLTVLVRRVGAGVSYDSYVKTNTFWVKSGLKLSTTYYESQNGKFKIKLPVGFVPQEESQNGENSFVAMPSAAYFPELMIFTAPTTQGDSLDAEVSSLKDAILSQLPDAVTNFAEVSKNKITLGNQQGYIVQYSMTISEGGVQVKLREFVILTLNQTNSNFLLFSTTDQDWAINGTIYTQSLNSFVPVTTTDVTTQTTTN